MKKLECITYYKESKSTTTDCRFRDAEIEQLGRGLGGKAPRLGKFSDNMAMFLESQEVQSLHKQLLIISFTSFTDSHTLKTITETRNKLQGWQVECN